MYIQRSSRSLKKIIIIIYHHLLVQTGRFITIQTMWQWFSLQQHALLFINLSFPLTLHVSRILWNPFFNVGKHAQFTGLGFCLFNLLKQIGFIIGECIGGKRFREKIQRFVEPHKRCEDADTACISCTTKQTKCI